MSSDVSKDLGGENFFAIGSGIMTISDEPLHYSLVTFSRPPHRLDPSALSAQLSILSFLWVHT